MGVFARVDLPPTKVSEQEPLIYVSDLADGPNIAFSDVASWACDK